MKLCAAAQLVLLIALGGAAASAQSPAGGAPAVAASSAPGAATYNLKIVSDASPDLSDLDSLIHSTTSRWPSIPEKVWALFYWTHILKRQTAPIVLHGFEVTDPIRNFTDYGFTMCSTICGNQPVAVRAPRAPAPVLGPLQSQRVGGRVPADGSAWSTVPCRTSSRPTMG